MKPDYSEIYAKRADMYERLIRREDRDGNLLPAIRAVRPPKDLDIIDLGAGTGRLTRLLASEARSVRAFDTSAAMLLVARKMLREFVLTADFPERLDITLALADHRRLPVNDASADLVIAGWSLCYAALHHPETWRDELDAARREISRVLRPGGTVLVIETLGTGNEEPRRSPEMQPYLEYLDEHGFRSTWIRTDYRFESPAEAEELIRFFFGDERADAVRRSGATEVPECTGIWWTTPAPTGRSSIDPLR